MINNIKYNEYFTKTQRLKLSHLDESMTFTKFMPETLSISSHSGCLESVGRVFVLTYFTNHQF